jgi:hypothetical protein
METRAEEETRKPREHNSTLITSFFSSGSDSGTRGVTFGASMKQASLKIHL